ncbi:hypothetical protein JZ751_023016 [Albula glossodonta]|uniref:Protein yippee-like n=1 Tax=Albula glossodonta TaxID=121402 RepID=A0A8T2PGU8_9TELE|nr:hypothetical protein JZ751_023016 [Albula glossodonta]
MAGNGKQGLRNVTFITENGAEDDSSLERHYKQVEDDVEAPVVFLLIVNLSCLGCSTGLGRIYTSTPKNLDYKRSLFCLSVENVDCYVLGSSEQKMVEDIEEEPVTLEYRGNVDLQVAKIKALAVSMGQRLLEIEAKLQNIGR